MFAVILGAFGDPFVGFAIFKKKNLDLRSCITLTPFNLITLSSSPFLATIGGGDFKRATTRRFGNLEGLITGIAYLLVLYRNDLDLVGTAGGYSGGYLPRIFSVILGLLGYPLVVLIRFKWLYLDRSTRVSFAPFNGIGFPGSPFLTAVRGSDF